MNLFGTKKKYTKGEITRGDNLSKLYINVYSNFTNINITQLMKIYIFSNLFDWPICSN